MKKYSLFIVLMLCSFTIFAQPASSKEYEGLFGFFQMVSDSIEDFWQYLLIDVPDWWERFVAWALVWYTKLKLTTYLNMLAFSWSVGKQILLDLNIMSQITAQVSVLPQDVRQALVSMRLFDGINIILNAWMTRFVKRTLY